MTAASSSFQFDNNGCVSLRLLSLPLFTPITLMMTAIITAPLRKRITLMTMATITAPLHYKLL
jgi:hypothetical protein